MRRDSGSGRRLSGGPVVVSEHHAANRGVLAWLRSWERPRDAPLSARPEDFADPYYGLGTHPDIVEHLWDRLGRALPSDGRCVVLGSVALVHPFSGVVLALGMGTSYALRLTPEDLRAALGAWHETVHPFATSGDVIDVSTWGEGWCFGRFDRSERAWCVNAFKRFGGEGKGLPR